MATFKKVKERQFTSDSGKITASDLYRKQQQARNTMESIRNSEWNDLVNKLDIAVLENKVTEAQATMILINEVDKQMQYYVGDSSTEGLREYNKWYEKKLRYQKELSSAGSSSVVKQKDLMKDEWAKEDEAYKKDLADLEELKDVGKASIEQYEKVLEEKKKEYLEKLDDRKTDSRLINYLKNKPDAGQTIIEDIDDTRVAFEAAINEKINQYAGKDWSYQVAYDENTGSPKYSPVNFEGIIQGYDSDNGYKSIQSVAHPYLTNGDAALSVWSKPIELPAIQDNGKWRPIKEGEDLKSAKKKTFLPIYDVLGQTKLLAFDDYKLNSKEWNMDKVNNEVAYIPEGKIIRTKDSNAAYIFEKNYFRPLNSPEELNKRNLNFELLDQQAIPVYNQFAVTNPNFFGTIEEDVSYPGEKPVGVVPNVSARTTMPSNVESMFGKAMGKKEIVKSFSRQPKNVWASFS